MGRNYLKMLVDIKDSINPTTSLNKINLIQLISYSYLWRILTHILYVFKVKTKSNYNNLVLSAPEPNK